MTNMGKCLWMVGGLLLAVVGAWMIWGTAGVLLVLGFFILFELAIDEMLERLNVLIVNCSKF